MTKFKKGFWILLGFAAVFFIILIILSSVLQLGERLASISIYLEYAFYGISGILFMILFVRPVLSIIFSPTFSIDTLFSEEENARKNFRMYKRVTRNLLKEDFISDEEKETLEKSMSDPMVLKENLSKVFDTTIKKELNKIIVSNAESVFMTTAISQNGRLDAIAVLTINLRLIRQLVEKCGFRPNYASLGRLSVSVLTTAVIAENLEDIKFNEIFPQSSLNALSEIPFVRTVTGSLAQGSGNALLALRVGIVCRNFLFMNLKAQSKKEIKRLAFAEAVTLFPSVIGESVKKVPKRITDIFKKIF